MGAPVIWERTREEIREVSREFWFSTTKVTWLLWLLILLPLAYYWGPKAFPSAFFARWFKNIAILGFLFPSLFTLLICGPLLLKLPRKRGSRYELGPKGAFRHDWQNGLSIGWKRIDTYRFSDHPQVPGIRVLELKVKMITRGPLQMQGAWCGLVFDPEVTSESEMEAVIRHYLGEAPR